MKIKSKLLLLVVCSLLSPVFADSDEAPLHDFYEQNGDCYVLVGSGTRYIPELGHKHRGVYSLHNLDGGSTEYLYDPDDAYGITAGQKYTAYTNSISKRLYTFSGQDGDPTPLTGQTVKRRMVATYSLDIYTDPSNPRASGVAPYTVHRFHSWPNSAATGLGNHDASTISWKFAGKDYPCNTVPVRAGSDDEGNPLYEYTVGDGYYHATDYSVWSPFTYDSYCSCPDLASADKADGTYSYGIDKYGGYVHFVIRENLNGIIRDLNLKKWNVEGHCFDGSDDFVARVTTKVQSTMDQRGECTDGCITEANGIELPGVESPILKTAYSSQVNRKYLYNRAIGDTAYTLTGVGGDDELRGNGASLDCEHLGISSKSTTGNYVYLLGKDLINQWLTESSYSGSLVADRSDLACVCVSDQWWQTGGIVYAYDKTQGKIYCFNRAEKELDLDGDGSPETSRLQEVIDVSSTFSSGDAPDRIACDGFANLYVLRTERIPENKSSFRDGNEVSKWVSATLPSGKKFFIAKYVQKVVKKVYKKPYGNDKTFSPVRNDIPLGENVYHRGFYTADNDINSPKIWTDLDYTLISAADNPSAIPVELAVINCPTPPRPDHLNARTDCVGPVTLPPDSYWQMATPDSDGLFNSNEDLFFIAENYPNFENHGLNVGNYEFDLDGDGKVGRYPNTIIKNEIKYYWRIVQTHDREGNHLKNAAGENIEKQVLPSDESEFCVQGGNSLLFPSVLEGRFKVGVKVTYSYYDYSKLPVGSFMSDRDTVPGVHVTGKVAKGDTDASGGWSYEEIGQKLVTMPSDSKDKGIIMVGRNGVAGNTFSPGRSVDGGECSSGCTHNQCQDNATFTTPVYYPNILLEDPKYILDGYSICKYVDDSTEPPTGPKVHSPDSDANAFDWALKLRDTYYNKANSIDRCAQLKGLPPDPHDPKMVPNSLEWINKNSSTGRNRFTVNWSSELCDDAGNVICYRTVTTDYDGSDEAFSSPSDAFCLPLDKLRELMPVPSEPLRYKIKASVESHYKYKYWHSIPMPKMEGGVMVGYTDPVETEVEKYVKIKFEGIAYICVLDNTGPGLYQYTPDNDGEIVKGYLVTHGNTDKFFLKATTGGNITDSGDIVFYVADNNPFANYTGVSSVALGETDAYHYNASDPKRSRLKVSFNKNNDRNAIFQHQALFNKGASFITVPAEVASLKANYTTTGADMYVPTEAELSALGLSTSKLISYTKYKFNISKIKDNSFIADADGNKLSSDKFDYFYANNMTGYDNLKFGLVWRETCNSSYNKLDNESDYAKYLNRGGIIVIVDNDRPNAFITAKHDRIDRVEEIPSGVPNATWTAGLLDENSGNEVWGNTPTDYDDINSISDQFLNYANRYGLDYSGLTPAPASDKPEAATVLFRGENKLYVDVPVTFNTFMFDNTGKVEIDNDGGEDCFKIEVVEYADEDDTTAQVLNGYHLDENGNPYIRQVFRRPGKYCVVLKVKDKPKGFPLTYDNAKNKLFPDATPNKRTVKAYFEVKGSKMEYRVLERSINGND